MSFVPWHQVYPAYADHSRDRVKMASIRRVFSSRAQIETMQELTHIRGFAVAPLSAQFSSGASSILPPLFVTPLTCPAWWLSPSHVVPPGRPLCRLCATIFVKAARCDLWDQSPLNRSHLQITLKFIQAKCILSPCHELVVRATVTELSIPFLWLLLFCCIICQDMDGDRGKGEGGLWHEATYLWAYNTNR